MTKYVILGAGGVLGSTLRKDLENNSNEVLPVTRQDFDLLNNEELNTFLNQIGQATIVNCVAFMPADKCEKEPELSKKVNVEFVESLVKAISKRNNQRLIQFSSDFVFDGESEIPYTPDALPNPLNIYGQHKYEAEKIVLENLPERGKVIRFASLVSHSTERKTFLEKVIDRAISTQKASVVSDLTISTATSELIAKVVEESHTMDPQRLHAVHSGITSWSELAKCAFDALQIDIPIEAVSSSQFPTPAKRPRQSALAPSPEVLKLDSRSWNEAVAQYVKDNIQVR